MHIKSRLSNVSGIVLRFDSFTVKLFTLLPKTIKLLDFIGRRRDYSQLKDAFLPLLELFVEAILIGDLHCKIVYCGALEIKLGFFGQIASRISFVLCLVVSLFGKIS